MVLVDPTLLTRALANMVENALHAMPGEGRLALSAALEGDWVVMRVRDTGVGMDAEALSRVFEPYFSTKATGTGLGLPIAQRNVELSGGTIDVESEKGVGTTVRREAAGGLRRYCRALPRALRVVPRGRGVSTTGRTAHLADAGHSHEREGDVGVGHGYQREARVRGDQGDHQARESAA